jgi:hypothetical protein
MKKKNNINEMQMRVTDFNKVKGKISPEDKKNLTLVPDDDIKAMGLMEDDDEIDAVIEPQDKATIKYLSNVIDKNTNEVSKPFTIDGKKYQMVHGLTPERQKVLAVFCHNDVDDEGNNVIHAVDHFEKTIAMPMMEKMKMGEKKKEEPKEKEELNLGHYKFFIVNEKTGKFRKIKTLEELAKDTLDKDEKFMGLKQFKKYFENKVFGSPKKSVKKENILEAMPEPATGQLAGQPAEDGDDIHVKAEKLMKLIKTKIPSVAIESIKTNKIAQIEVIAAFAEIVGVPRQGLTGLLKDLKTQATTKPTQQPVTESKLITKAQLSESLKQPKIIKTIKVKDLK